MKFSSELLKSDSEFNFAAFGAVGIARLFNIGINFKSKDNEKS